MTVSCRESHNLLLGQMSDGSICSSGTFSVIFTIFWVTTLSTTVCLFIHKSKLALSYFLSELKSEKTRFILNNQCIKRPDGKDRIETPDGEQT